MKQSALPVRVVIPKSWGGDLAHWVCMLLTEANEESSGLAVLVQCPIYCGYIKLTKLLATQNIVRIMAFQSIFKGHHY